MCLRDRVTSTLVAVLVLTFAVRAQVPGDRPQPPQPKRVETRQELDHRESVRLYGQGLLAEKQSRLLEAVGLYEKAAQLDAEAAAPLRSLAPLYLALDRLDDALAACKKATELDPADFATWHLYSRQLRSQNRQSDAADALTRALASPGLKEQPDLHAQVAFDLGALRETLGHYPQAETAFLEVVKLLENPAALLELGELNRAEILARATDTYERLGRVCLRAGKPEKAIAYFVQARDKVKDKDPQRSRRLGYNLAEVHAAAGRWEDALSALDEYLLTLPQGTEAYQAKITALEKLGRAGQVVPMLEAQLERDKHNSGLRLLFAERLAAAGQTGRAEGVYEAMAREAPGPEVYRGLFKLYAEVKPTRYDRLLDLIDRTLTQAGGDEDIEEGEKAKARADAAARGRAMLAALRENPAWVRGLLPAAQQRLLGQGLGYSTTYYLGVLAARTRLNDIAEQMLRNSLGKRNTRGFNRNPDADIYQALIGVLNRSYKYEEVVQLCRQARTQAPNLAPGYFFQQEATALAQLGRADEAVAAADRAVDVSPDTERLDRRAARAHVQTLLGRHDAAIAECLALVKLSGDKGPLRQARHRLANAYSAARRFAEAEEQLRLLLRDAPDDAWTLNDLGYYWADQGKNLEEAERYIRKALEIDTRDRARTVETEPVNAAYVDSLGWVLFRLGRFDEARKELERAAALPDGADDPTVWDHLGDVLFRQGDTGRAAEAWRKAVHLWEVVRSRAMDEAYKETKRKLTLVEHKQP